LRYENLDSIQLGLASNWKKVLGPDGRKINPVDMYKGWKGLGWDNSYNFFGKINFNLTTDIRVLFSYLLDKRYRQFNNFNAYYDYNMQGQNIQLLSSNKESLTINHTLSGLTFYSLRLSRFFEKRDIRILKDYSNKYASSFNIFSPPEDNLKTPEEYIPYASSSAVYDPFETSFYLLADNRWYSGDFSTNYEARFDFTSQLNQQYLLETGFQLNLLDIDYHSYQNISSVDPYPTIYNYSPIEAATFIQLKAEYESIIFNIGGRLDYLNSNSYAWEDPFDPLGEQNIGSDSIIFNPLYKVEPKLRFSPRLGIAYPLTDASVISFNFGHFFQTPNYRDMYQASGENRETSVIRGNIIGNANLLPEKSIQYEISLQQQFTDDLAVRFNLFTKETVNQVGSVVVPAYSDPGKDNPFTYSTFINNNLGSARGFEVNLTKRLSNNFAFYFNYTFSVAKVLQPTSWDGYWSGDTNNDIPRKETTAPWDQTHVIRTNFQYSFPNSQNSENLISHLLSNMNMTIFYYGESGMPYTPTVSSGKVIEPYSEQWPFSHRIDLQISKMWDFLGLRLIGLLQIKNLFDTQNVLSGYTLTGSATDPGTSTYYTLSSSYWDSRNNNNFKISRTIYLGIELQFGGRGY
jgi:outer membrane receptor protein involved in Fe transport